MAIRELVAYRLKAVLTDLLDRIESLDWAKTRGEAISNAKSLGLPSSTEELWRYTDVEDTDFDSFDLTAAKPEVQVKSEADLVIVDGWLVVGAESSSDAWSVQTSSPQGNGVDFFSAAATALTPYEVVIDISADTEISIHVAITKGTVAAPLIQINTADGVSSSVSIEIVAEPSSMCLPKVLTNVGTRSNAVVAIASQGAGSSLVGQIETTVGSQAQSTVEVVGGDTELSRFATVAHLSGRGCSFKMVSPSYLTSTQSSDHRVLVHHEAKDTTSDLLFRNVIDGQSKSIYSGVVKIHESGAGTNAVQENKTLSLSDDAWAHSVPNLEINNNEVACSHASTVSPVDYDQQFYLQSRGLSPEVADEAIVRGFLADVVSKLSNSMAKRRVQEIVDHQIRKQAS